MWGKSLESGAKGRKILAKNHGQSFFEETEGKY